MQLKFDKRQFRSKCSVSCSLDLIGDKWTLLIIRDAMFKGYTSFNQFRNSTEKIASNILAARLEKLVSNGILTKTKNPTNQLKFDYELTDIGLNLRPVLLALGKWGYESIDNVNNMNDVIKEYDQN